MPKLLPQSPLKFPSEKAVDRNSGGLISPKTEYAMEGVEEVSLHSIRPGSFTLDIVFKGNTEAFRDSLGLKTFERFRLDPEEVDAYRVGFLMVVTDALDG